MDKKLSRSSRNTLNEHHLHLFPGDTLFDRIAQAVCRAGTLPRKELYEAWEVARRVRKKFRRRRIIDCACGHGLLAHIMLILDDGSPEAIAVDKSIPESATRLSQALIQQWPRLAGRITYVKQRIETFQTLSGDLLVSVHGCGLLTDTILTKAIETPCPVAVLPCCQSKSKCDSAGLEGWMDRILAIDTARAMRMQYAGFRTYTRTIPSDITPKNRLLLAEPDESARANDLS